MANALWESYPKEVQSLLNLAQVYVDARTTMEEVLGGDVVRLRRSFNRDINSVIDRVGEADDNLRRAVRDYQSAGGNGMLRAGHEK